MKISDLLSKFASEVPGYIQVPDEKYTEWEEYLIRRSIEYATASLPIAEGRCKCVDSDPAPVCGSCGKPRR
jgi:hypothetical protein